MRVPDPTVEFSLYSIYDRAPLECRVYHPIREGKIDDTTTFQRGAIVAHPYAPLGGCFDDHVVLSIVSTLLQSGFVVSTFNFRGAGGSGGSNSWSAKAEVTDYMTIAGFMVHYLSNLQKPEQGAHALNILFAGYSYGSMIVTMLPSTAEILARFSRTHDDPAAEVVREALTMANAFQKDHNDTNALHKDHTSAEIPEVRSHYLLISNPLPPTSTFIAPLARQSMSSLGPDQLVSLTTNPTLALFGEEDGLVSDKKAKRWSERLEQVHDSKFRHEIIAEAGHFWKEPGVLALLQSKTRDWVRGVFD